MTIFLPIAETFVSIQGEGALAGTPSWFVRTSGCNLRCVWCDTPYASWSPEGEKRSVDALVAEAKAAGVRHAVVTGGEPMMFESVTSLTGALHDTGLHVTIETAGTVRRDVSCDLMSISPKLANSTPINDPRDPDGAWQKRHDARRLDIPALQGLIDDHRERQFKFVATDESDLTEIDDLLGRLTGWRPEQIMLMPEGVDVDTIRSRTWIADACIRRGWRYCPRLHIDLFGDARGT